MKKQLLWRDAWQAIGRTKGRFIAIFLLMAVASLTLVGLKMTGPDMRQTARHFYAQTHLADLTVTSPAGLTPALQATLRQEAGVKRVEFVHTADAVIKDDQTAIRITSLGGQLSKAQLVSGRLPKHRHEIALSYLLAKHYHRGQWLTLTAAPGLKVHRVKVVGFIRSSEYLDRNQIGNTTVGSGQLGGVAVLPKAAFRAEKPQLARLTLTATAGQDPYATSYQATVAAKQRHLQTTLRHQLTTQSQAQVAQLTARLPGLRQAAATNPAAAATLQTAQRQIAQLKAAPQGLTVQTREANPGYAVYRSNSARIDLVANVFPVFMFAVAILVALTTMARFVAEERQKIGTFKALGYSNFDVAKKFLLYSTLAATGGTLVGAAGGFWLLPRLIFSAYAANSTISGLQLGFSWGWLLTTWGLAVGATGLAAGWVLAQDAREIPAQLLLPPTPKGGARLWLEHVTPVWRRLAFKHKATLRNLWRYKSRMLMTILGVAGCTGLLVMGFGIRDSLGGIAHRQYGQLIKYDLLAVQKPTVTAASAERLDTALAQPAVAEHTAIHYETLTRRFAADPAPQTVALLVPHNAQQFRHFMTLRTRTSQKRLDLNAGVIISEKLATLAQVKVGDRLRLQDAQGQWRSMKVGAITEMYMGHFMVMNQATYQHYFGQPYRTNAQLLKLAAGAKVNPVARQLMATGALAGINENRSNQQMINNLLNSMDRVMVILIGLATVLAAVVIYNLTNINVEERSRELATLKVLGYDEGEATLYIYRETIILSVVGIFVGFLLGRWLHGFIITNLPPVDAMFDPQMRGTNFLLSAAIPLVITALVAVVMQKKIQKISMLAALQARE